MNNNRPYLFDLTLKELEELVMQYGEPGFRAKQIYEWIYIKSAGSFDEMSSLSKKFREKLSNEFEFTRLYPQIELQSSDGWTRKILFSLPAHSVRQYGQAGAPGKSQIETVLMGYTKRRTACISTQAGCALGCTFCATGQGGLQRNISSGEIVEQVMFFQRELKNKMRSLPILFLWEWVNRLQIINRL